jgi:hypothetical protein
MIIILGDCIPSSFNAKIVSCGKHHVIGTAPVDTSGSANDIVKL